MDKRVKTLIMAIAIALIVAIASTSYAFFTIANKEGEETVIKSGTMGLHLEDGPEVSLENAVPGSSVTKTFYVENTGNVDTAYDLYLSEVVNTFVDKTDLVYTLTSNDGGYSTTGQVEAPSASAKIVDSEPIGVGDIHHYTLVLTFLEKNENQDDNQGVEFKGKIQINEYKEAGSSDPEEDEEVEDSDTFIRVLSGNINTIGSEVAIGDEHFYVIGKDSNNKTKLFAKYNLGVGSGYTTPLNKQDINSTYGRKGYTSFASSVFWEEPANPNTRNFVNIYTNEKVNGEYIMSSAKYVDDYVDYLTTLGVDVSGRFVLLEDLDAMGCDIQHVGCHESPYKSWVIPGNYYYGFTANSSPWVQNAGNIYYGPPLAYATGAIRPVIILNKNYKKYNETVHYYLDNELVSTMPEESKNYDSYTCTNGATVDFYENYWKYDVTNVTQNNTVCNLYFTTPSTSEKYIRTADASNTNERDGVTSVVDAQWEATYVCNNGTATIQTCRFKGNIDGHYYNEKCQTAGGGCTKSVSTTNLYPYSACNPNISNSYSTYVISVAKGGGLPETESC